MLIDAAGLRARSIGAILSETEAGGVMEMPVFGSKHGAVSHPRAGRRAACEMHAPAKARGDRGVVSAVRRAVCSAPRLARDESGWYLLGDSQTAPRGPLCTASKFAALLPLPCAARVSGTAEAACCWRLLKPYGSFRHRARPLFIAMLARRHAQKEKVPNAAEPKQKCAFARSREVRSGLGNGCSRTAAAARK